MGYWIVKAILTPFLRVLFRPWAEGMENVPATGGAILASNHLSVADHYILALLVPRRVTFMAKSDYFTERGLKGRVRGFFMRAIGQLPIDRSGGRASEPALRAALKILGRNEIMGIYPEGTRSPDGRLYRGKTGVARMALTAGVPVVPVAMVGTERMQPPGRVLPRIMRVGVRVGEPLDFSRYAGKDSDRFVLRSVTDEIMYELMLLSGQEYVDTYATKAKADLVAQGRLDPKLAGAGAAPPRRAR